MQIVQNGTNVNGSNNLKVCTSALFVTCTWGPFVI